MLSLVEVGAIVGAVLLHLLLGYGLSVMPDFAARENRPIEIDMLKRAAPPPPMIAPPKVEPPPPPEPPKKVAVRNKVAPPQTPPPPNRTPPPEPPKAAVKPVFGVTMESTTDSDSNVAMNVGNTTMIDPTKSAKHSEPVQPLPAAPPPQARPSYDPVSPLDLRKEADIDADACGHSVQYPSEAEQLGVEGQVILRIELEESGKVHAVKVLKGLGHGLDEAAVRAMKFRGECRFKPAIGKDGKPKAVIIERYVFNFELPR